MTTKKLQNRLTTAFATGAVLLQALAPMTYATTLTISGNGSDSVSNVSVESNRDVQVNQKNDANVLNNVTVTADTGNNSASDNTGGDVEVKTGDAKAVTSVSNALNSNAATVDACCEAGKTEVTVSGNGTGSSNDVSLEKSNTVALNQENYTNVTNNVKVKAETGDNDADSNTGGDVKVKTGSTDTTVKLSTMANANNATVAGGDSNGGVSAWISGNGSDSENAIELALGNSVALSQENNANVENNAKVYAETGDNTADDNTGGHVSVDTGDAKASVEFDTMVNFNGADVEGCGCLGDLKAKINGNGTDSMNEISYEADDVVAADQYNAANATNNAKVDAETGDNDADDNTGAVDTHSDPSVQTGDTHSQVKVSNAGNQNTLGEDVQSLLNRFEFDFDFGGLFGLFVRAM